jgi:hypothetical protein
MAQTHWREARIAGQAPLQQTVEATAGREVTGYASTRGETLWRW